MKKENIFRGFLLLKKIDNCEPVANNALFTRTSMLTYIGYFYVFENTIMLLHFGNYFFFLTNKILDIPFHQGGETMILAFRSSYCGK